MAYPLTIPSIQRKLRQGKRLTPLQALVWEQNLDPTTRIHLGDPQGPLSKGLTRTLPTFPPGDADVPTVSSRPEIAGENRLRFVSPTPAKVSEAQLKLPVFREHASKMRRGHPRGTPLQRVQGRGLASTQPRLYWDHLKKVARQRGYNMEWVVHEAFRTPGFQPFHPTMDYKRDKGILGPTNTSIRRRNMKIWQRNSREWLKKNADGGTPRQALENLREATDKPTQPRQRFVPSGPIHSPIDTTPSGRTNLGTRLTNPTRTRGAGPLGMAGLVQEQRQSNRIRRLLKLSQQGGPRATRALSSLRQLQRRIPALALLALGAAAVHSLSNREESAA